MTKGPSTPDSLTRAPAPSTNPGEGHHWDEHQQQVIEAPHNKRLVVDAGPGTGKTAVACARIAWLIDQGIEPTNIWLISFTRTAVKELRNRIAELSGQEARAREVRIATLDSQAWHLRAGFDLDGPGKLFTGYEKSIQAALELLQGDDPEVVEYFNSFEHLIVDEAQDLVGVRAELVEAIIEVLPDLCGVSIFTDDAQAIYGFSESGGIATDEVRFTQRIRGESDAGFEVHELREVYRTDSPSLRQIFVGTRKLVVDPGAKPDERLEQVVQDIKESADGEIGGFLAEAIRGKDDTLVLFRRRVEVLTASSFLRSKGIVHRLRMSGLPTVCAPWVARVLHDAEERYMPKAVFLERFEERTGLEREDCADEAWKTLFKLSGENGGRLDLHLLRKRIGGERSVPDLTEAECGSRGPIIGTIHASKGREALNVHLMLPETPRSEDIESDEEARVMFVGATRSRRTLKIGKGYGTRASSLRGGTGRVYKFGRGTTPAAQVEFGRAGDVDYARQTSRSLFETSADAQAAQVTLASFDGEPRDVMLVTNVDRDWQMEIRIGDANGQVIGVLTECVRRDLFDIGSHVANSRKIRTKLWPSMKVNHCKLIGVSSHVLRDDDSTVEGLHAPFAGSGMYLVPIISGFSMVYFNGYQ